MSDEVSQAEVPAPTPEVTAEPVVEVSAPEVPEAAPKTFSQEELDAAIGKRLAREQRKWERERAVQPVAPQAPVTPEQFASNEDYVEALAEQRAEQKLAERDHRVTEQRHRQATWRNGEVDSQAQLP